MTRAVVYDFDDNKEFADGVDVHGAYVVREIDYIEPHTGYARLKNGQLSRFYELLDREERYDFLR